MNADPSSLDDLSYLRFIGPQRIQKAFHTLEGILKGIALDGKIEPLEQKELSDWCEDHHKFANRHPFNEIFPQISTGNSYADEITGDIQRLQGIVHGITADGKIEKEELEALQNWLDENEQLVGCYPYDELNTVISSVLKDGMVDAQEHEQLLQFFTSFVNFSLAKRVSQCRQAVLSKKELTLPGVCAMCPTIEFPERYFCLTGLSGKGRKSDFANAVTELHGIFVDSVPQFLNYLVVGSVANPAWAFCCYGRKIEAAMKFRKEGKRILIVHENDFWDSAEDFRAGVI